MIQYLTKLNRLTIGAIILLCGLFMSTTPDDITHSMPIITASTKLTNVDSKQLACMAKNIFYEAGGESIIGQAAVARVVMNRVNHGFAKSPCGVIYQTTHVERINEQGLMRQAKLCQFSWVCEGKTEPNKNNQRYKQAQQVAYEVMVNDRYKEVVPKTALFFHNVNVDPMWPYKQVKKIGNHIFYSKQPKQKSKSEDA